MEKNLTIKQISNACEKHKYLLLRFRSGHLMGVNSKVANILKSRNTYNENQETDFMSFRPCDLIEYINHKHPFFKPNQDATKS